MKAGALKYRSISICDKWPGEVAMSTHKFDPENRKKLNSKLRQEILPPDRVLMDIGLEEQAVWADIGCGTGFFTIPLAHDVKQVYALDIRAEMLNDLRVTLSQQQINNVEVLQSEESRFPLPDGLVNGALVSLVLHEADQPLEFFRELSRILQSGGRLIIIEWAKDSVKMGPPSDHRLSIQQLDDWAFFTGFNKIRSWQWSETFIGVEYNKNP
jgi:ubiquinone/menaquinone biosynthesis C-methylase UbiE